MTILERPQFDIATSSRTLVHQRQASGQGLDFFSRQALGGDWQRWFDWLVEIHTSPESVEDDLTTCPSNAVVALATELLKILLQEYAEPPDTAVIGPNGEIIFERRIGNRAVQFIIHDDLRVDTSFYVDGRLVMHEVVASGGFSTAS